MCYCNGMTPTRLLLLAVGLVMGIWAFTFSCSKQNSRYPYKYSAPEFSSVHVVIGGSDSPSRSKVVIGDDLIAKRKAFRYAWEEADQYVDVLFLPKSIAFVMSKKGIGATLVEQVRTLGARNGQTVEPVLKHGDKYDSLSFTVKDTGPDSKYFIEDVAYLLDSDPNDKFGAISEEDLKPANQ